MCAFLFTSDPLLVNETFDSVFMGRCVSAATISWVRERLVRSRLCVVEHEARNWKTQRDRMEVGKDGGCYMYVCASRTEYLISVCLRGRDRHGQWVCWGPGTTAAPGVCLLCFFPWWHTNAHTYARVHSHSLQRHEQQHLDFHRWAVIKRPLFKLNHRS